MHLAVNAVGIKHSGGATVLLDFLRAALENPRITCLTLFCSPRTVRRFDLPVSPKLYCEEQPLAERSYAVRIWWFQVGLARACRRVGADILFCMVGASRGDAQVPHVTFIQQSLPFSAEVRRRYGVKDQARMLILKQLMAASCRSAQCVVVQTPTMQQWVSKAFHLPIEKCSIAWPTPPNPVDTTGYAPLKKIEQAPHGMRLLYVGSESPHKNLALIVAAMSHLRKTLPEAILFLSLPEDHQFSQLPGVICLGYLSGGGLWQAYAQCDLLVMPSLVETVGLPMLEALISGMPVLAADRPYAHDICGSAAIFFDPLSAFDCARQAVLLLSDQALQATMIDQGKQRVTELRQKTSGSAMIDVLIACL